MKIEILAQLGTHREALVTALACLGHSAKVIEKEGKFPSESKYYIVVESDKIKEIKR